jgi:hypothetical protein
VGVYNHGDKTGGSDDEAAGQADRGDIGDFNSQYVANMLRAFRTMETKPVDQMMR